MKSLLAWLLLTAAALAQQPFPGVPPGWSLYVVHAPWCAPCQRFRNDYNTIDIFRNKLETGFAVKSVEWDRPSEQRWAKRFAIASLPGFIVFRDGIHQQSFSGYDGNWQGFLNRLNLESDGAESGKVKSGTPQEPIRPVTPTEQALPEITDLRLQIDRLREQLREQARKQTDGDVVSPSAPVAIDATRQADSSKSPPLPTLAIPAAGHSVGTSVGADWARVGAAVLALAAPQFALPAGAIGVAGTVFQMLRRRRQQMQAQQQQHRQTVIERPVIVPTDTPPPPARVEQTTHYVPIERETHREAWQWAADQYARKYPGSEGLIQALNHLIGQYESSKREAA